MYVFVLIYWFNDDFDDFDNFDNDYMKVERDILAIGTPTTLLAYDVENNSDLFYKEVIL